MALAKATLPQPRPSLLRSGRIISPAPALLHARPQGQQPRRQHLTVTASDRRPRGGGGPKPQQVDPVRLLKEYGMPTLGLLLAASFIGPLVGGLVFSALSLSVLIAAGAAALSISWIFVPIIVALFGMPALWAGGMAAGLFGALLLPTLFQLALVGGGLWLGTVAAQRLFFGGGGGDNSGGVDGVRVGPDGIVDVEAETVDDWQEEVSKEQKDREAELREFDDLLRRREDFKNKGRY